MDIFGTKNNDFDPVLEISSQMLLGSFTYFIERRLHAKLAESEGWFEQLLSVLPVLNVRKPAINLHCNYVIGIEIIKCFNPKKPTLFLTDFMESCFLGQSCFFSLISSLFYSTNPRHYLV